MIVKLILSVATIILFVVGVTLAVAGVVQVLRGADLSAIACFVGAFVLIDLVWEGR